VPLTQVGVPVGVVYLVDTSNAMGKEEAMDKVKAALTDAVAKARRTRRSPS
jgi:Mg-chelatase subunit ChlD